MARVPIRGIAEQVGVSLTIPYARLLVRYRLNEQVRVNGFWGGHLKSAMGRALRETSCVFPGAPCRHCLLRFDCAFASTFYSFVHPMDSRPVSPRGITTNRPHTFVMRPAASLEDELGEGEILEFQLLLLAEQLDRQGWWIASLVRLAEVGLRRRGNPMELVEIKQLTEAGPLEIYQQGSDTFSPLVVEELELPLMEMGRREPTYRLQIEALTPVRLRVDGTEPVRPTPLYLWRAVIRRVKGMASSLGLSLPGPQVIHPYPADPLAWEMIDQYRWSSTQKRKLPAGGYRGKLSLRDVPAEHVGWWIMAGALGVGKLATFGMGALRVRVEEEGKPIRKENLHDGRS